jgi:hypothetical protein
MSESEKYLDVIDEQWSNILKLYKEFEDKKPIMLYDMREKRISAYPYESFKSDLTKKSQTILEKQYYEAVSNNKIVVFVRDNEQGILISSSYNLE